MFLLIKAYVEYRGLLLMVVAEMIHVMDHVAEGYGYTLTATTLWRTVLMAYEEDMLQ